jgi:isopentenyl diphosphate isomerase/L-lactate dehydrogenase-like FMN-dependent dehydrogenase
MVKTPNEFSALHQIVKAAYKNLDQNPWDYIVGGADTETTIKRNRYALDKLTFRPRVLNDVTDLKTFQ